MSTVPDPHSVPTRAHTGNVLTRKFGPLELWVWVVIGLAAVFLGWRYWRARGTSTASVSATSATDSQADSSGSSTDPSTGGLYSTGMSNVGGVSAGVAAGSTSAAPTDDTAWATQATQYLESTGVSPTDASNAISGYLSGQPLTTAQGGLLNQALTGTGLPPSGVQAVTIAAAPTVAPTPDPTPAPAPAPAPSPATVAAVVAAKPKPKTSTVYTTYTTRSGDTIAGIAKSYYGKATTAEETALKAKNSYLAGKSVTAKLAAGHKLEIPHTITA